MIMDHPPPRRRPNPDRREPAGPVTKPAAGENVLARGNGLIGTDGTNLEMIVAENLRWSARPPESPFHLTLDPAHAAYQSRRPHRCRSIDVRREVNRQLPAIPSRRSRIEDSLDCGGVARRLKSGIGVPLPRTPEHEGTCRDHQNSSHHLDSG